MPGAQTRGELLHSHSRNAVRTQLDHDLTCWQLPPPPDPVTPSAVRLGARCAGLVMHACRLAGEGSPQRVRCPAVLRLSPVRFPWLRATSTTLKRTQVKQNATNPPKIITMLPCAPRRVDSHACSTGKDCATSKFDHQFAAHDTETPAARTSCGKSSEVMTCGRGPRESANEARKRNIPETARRDVVRPLGCTALPYTVKASIRTPRPAHINNRPQSARGPRPTTSTSFTRSMVAATCVTLTPIIWPTRQQTL